MEQKALNNVKSSRVSVGRSGPCLARLPVAQRHLVTLAATQDGLAVIGKGLQAGVRVVVAGQYRLTNGSRIKIRPMEAAQSRPRQQTE